MVSPGHISFYVNNTPLEMLQICANIALQVGLGEPAEQNAQQQQRVDEAGPSTSASSSSQPVPKRRHQEEGSGNLNLGGFRRFI